MAADGGNASRGKQMPEIVVYMVEGRPQAQKTAMMKDITEAVVRNLSVPPEVVVVQIVEARPQDKSKGGIPFNERPR
jgi:4-oxalocrotonate tautomerase